MGKVISLQQTKEDLKRDYNKAVKAFNEGEYIDFGRHFRPAIENLPKFFVFSLLGGEGNAIKLLNGEAVLTKTGLARNNKHEQPKGKKFIDIFCDVLTYKQQNAGTKFKNEYDSYIKQLYLIYDQMSDSAQHTGIPDFNREKQANSSVAIIEGFLDNLKVSKIFDNATIEFLNTLDAFDSSNKRLKDKEEEIQQFKEEANEREENDKRRISELELENKELEEKNKSKDELIKSYEEKIGSYKLQDSISIVEKDNNWSVSEEKIDDEQFDIIDIPNDQSLLVTGCAGSGKSVIAMHKAMNLSKEGHSVILIVYTKSLSRFMEMGGRNSYFSYYYYKEWETKNKPSADYIIVDEIQDFTKEEIQEFIDAAKKHFIFFGDTAQSIYYKKKTMSIEAISQMTGLTPMILYTNYRLPRPVAKITQAYVGINVPEYKDKIYKNKTKELPHFVKFDSDKSQLEGLIEIINKNKNKKIGILLNNNLDVLMVTEFLHSRNVFVEFKYTIGGDTPITKENLNFRSSYPKVMTCHSAKGLQFDVVILPFFKGTTNDDERKTLYVAMTRTMESLYILYSSPEVPPPLNAVKSHLYLKK